MEATRLHFSLGTSYEAPVDVLDIARQLDLFLMMQPLDNLLGFYVRRPEAAGIVINSRVPESLQRFTLAHEIGHHVLGHEGTADDRHTLDRFDPDSVVEVQAQAFAAALLMPVPLVNRVLRDLPATQLHRELRDTDAYLFSRQLGVSFAAGVWALYRRNLISLTQSRRFIKRGALAAKAAVTGRAPVDNARADVWVLTEENDDLTVLCRIGDEIHVQLSEDTSNGHAWAIRVPDIAGFYHPATAHNAVSWDGGSDLVETNSPLAPDADLQDAVEVIHDEHVGHQSATDATRWPGTSSPLPAQGLVLPGLRHGDEAVRYPSGDGVREITFVPRREGPTHVRIELVHPWEQHGGAVQASYDLDLMVRSRQLAGAGLFAPQADVWVDEHTATA